MKPGRRRIPAEHFQFANSAFDTNIGRTKAYQEIAAGRLRAVKVGRRTLITHDAAEAWLAALPELNSLKSDKH